MTTGVKMMTFLLRQTLSFVTCSNSTSYRRKMRTPSVGDASYLKFSHGATSYALDGKNVNVMLALYFL